MSLNNPKVHSLKNRLAFYFVMAFMAVISICFSVIYYSQKNFLLKTANSTISSFLNEFHYEYICAEEEPLNSQGLLLKNLPPKCLLTCKREIPDFTPRCALIIEEENLIHIAGTVNNLPALIVYSTKTDLITSYKQIPMVDRLNFILTDFTEESFGKEKNEVFLMLISKDGKCIAKSDFHNKYVESFLALPQPDPNGQEVQIIVNRRNTKILTLRQRLFDGNILLAAVNLRYARKNLAHLRLIFILTLFAVFPIGIAVAMFAAKRFTAGLERVAAAAQEIEKGNFSIRVQQKHEGREIDDLVHAFNNMSTTTEKVLENLKNVTDNVAHNLKTPLTRMRAKAELELFQNHDSALAGLVAGECDDMLSLINTMLEITQTEMKLGKTKLEPVDIAELISKIVTAFSTLAEDKQILLNTNMPDTPVILNCHKKHLEQMMANLIDNALKFTPENGTINISLTVSQQEIAISVADTGVGIAPKDLPYIFDRFFRADASRSVPGNGLGLSMVKAVASSLGGNVTVDTELAKGTSFIISIPHHG